MFFIPIQISLTNAVCFCIISLHLQILPGKTILVVTISVPWSSQPPSNQTSSQSVLKKSLKTDSGRPYEADLQRQLYDLQLRDEQAELLTPQIPLKTESFRPQTEVECIECDETWQGSSLPVCQFFFHPMTSVVTSQMMSKFGMRTKIQERNGKNVTSVFCIEFYDFQYKPHLNRIKRTKVTAN